MNNQPSVREPMDKSNINIGNPSEARWWAKELDSNLFMLMHACDVVGTNVETVKAWLRADAQERLEIAQLSKMQAAQA